MTRPDRHLDSEELDALVRPAVSGACAPGLPEDALREAYRHVESCQECSRKVHVQKSLQDALSRVPAAAKAAPAADCRQNFDWVGLAAGTVPESETKELMKHAAQCDHCGPLLRAAVTTLSDDATPEEETLLANLTSARPEWKSKMAQALQAAARPSQGRELRPSWWTGLFRFPRPAFALAALALIAGAAWLGMRILHPPSVEGLLAQAYSERRTLEVRIPAAKYAPLRVERGPSGSNLDRPPALLQAEALIGENLAKHPNDPEWLEMRARADLLDGNYDSAIKTLQRAQQTEPDSPQLWNALGSAYFLRAEATDRASDYGNAVEQFGRALAKSPDDPIALYNEALACEQIFLYTQAIDNWEHYLRVDNTGPWADEARKRLTAIQEKLKEHGERVAEPVLTPQEIAQALVDHQKDVSGIDKQPERYMDVAWKSWLPSAIGGSSDSRAALKHLADSLKSNHDDPWLEDFGQNPSSETLAVLRKLLDGEEALNTGQYDRSAQLAQQSVRDFRDLNNAAGMFRAEYAAMRALASELDYAECLETGDDTLLALARTQYRWLNGAVLIQEAECLSGAAKLQEAIKTNQRALDLAEQFHYPNLDLRAKAFASRYLLDTNNSELGFHQLRDGLATFWQYDASDKNGELLYALLPNFADQYNWPRVEAFTWAELLNRFPSNNPVDRALELEFLAGAQRRAGNLEAAQTVLQRAAEQLASLPNDSGAILRRAEIVLDKAEIDLALGDANGAVSSLAPLRVQFEAASLGQFQANYFKVLGEAYLSLGQAADAQPLLKRALTVMETGVKSLTQEADKLSWSRTQSEVYRDLLELKIKTESPEEAFAWWEWYKGASLRSSEVTQPATMNDPRLLAPIVNSSPTSDARQAIVSYALLRNSIAAFALYQGTTHTYSFELPRDLEDSVQRFLDLCSDPSSDLKSLNAQGQHLYDILIAPLESDIHSSTALIVETDGILDQIPFALLHGQDGHNLGDEFELVFSQGIAYRARQRTEDIITPDSPALVVVSSGTENGSLPTLPDATAEGDEVASLFNHPRMISAGSVTREQVLTYLKDAQVFHFAGHAVADADRAGLVLGPEATLTSRDLATVRPHHLSLAVLSACESANGSEGTVADANSVARTLAAAGVPSIVATRWKVDSSVTRQFMQVFYASLMSGKTPSNSLRAASLAIRSIPQYRHPYYWASFAVFGSI